MKGNMKFLFFNLRSCRIEVVIVLLSSQEQFIIYFKEMDGYFEPRLI